MRLIWVFTILSGISSVIADPSPPEFPAQFNATILVTHPTQVKDILNWAMNYNQQRQWQQFVQNAMQTQLINDFAQNREYTVIHAIQFCLNKSSTSQPVPRKFLSNPNFVGTQDVNGIKCEHWSGVYQGGKQQQADYFQKVGTSVPVLLQFEDQTIYQYNSWDSTNIKVGLPGACDQ